MYWAFGMAYEYGMHGDGAGGRVEMELAAASVRLFGF